MEKKIPLWAEKKLGADFESAIAGAIRAVESQTQAEILPVLVRTSAAYGHVKWILFFIFFLLGEGLKKNLAFDAWYPLRPWQFDIGFLILSGAAALFLAQFALIRRWFTARIDMERAVFYRAAYEFNQSRVAETLSKCGVLLFLSLDERQAVVLADSTIASQVEPAVWSSVISALVKGARERHLLHGITAAIAECGKIVIPLFPIQPNDQNEIADRLIIRD